VLAVIVTTIRPQTEVPQIDYLHTPSNLVRVSLHRTPPHSLQSFRHFFTKCR